MKHTRIKAVIFDMDGIIVDSEPIQSLSWERFFIERGIKPIYLKNGLLHEIGPTADNENTKILERHGLKEDILSARKRRREIFETLIKKRLTLMPGFYELANRLKKEKIKMAVASSRLAEHIHIMLDIVRVKDLFETIVGPSPTLKRKPAPDIYLHAARQLGLKTEECLALEDSETGVLSAYHAGIKVIAVPSTFTLHQDFSKADKIVTSLSDITIPLINTL